MSRVWSSWVTYSLRLPVAGLEIAWPFVLNLPPCPDVHTETPLLNGIRSYPLWVQLFLNAFTVLLKRRSIRPWELIIFPSVTTEPPFKSRGVKPSEFRSISNSSLWLSSMGDDTTFLEQLWSKDNPAPVAHAQKIFDDVFKNSRLFT